MRASASIADRYNALVAGVKLLDVRLAKAEISAPNIYVADPDQQLEAEISTSATFKDLPSGFMARAGLKFEGYRGKEDGPQVSVAIELELLYSSAEPMTDELFEIFQRRNLPLNAWPYFREMLQSSLARTGWPIYTLPVLHSRWNDSTQGLGQATSAAADTSEPSGTGRKSPSPRTR